MLTVDFALLPVKTGEKILDLGCGSGRHSWHVCKLDSCFLCAMDYDVVELQKNRYVLALMDDKNETKGAWNLVQGNAMRLPFRDGTFDKIICSEVMEHVVDDEQAAKELFRVLKDEGLLAVSVPARTMESLYWRISEAYHTNPGGHIRIYRLSELTSMLQRNNLAVYAIRRKHAFHSLYWLLRCLFGVRNEKAAVPALYHRFLAWDIDKKYRVLRRLEVFLDHFFPKSVVVYVRKDNQKVTATAVSSTARLTARL